MKRFFLSLLAMIPILAVGQSFVLTPTGLCDADNPSKDYVVIEIEGKSAADLYTAAKSYINQTMKNPKFAIKADVDNDYIRYNIYVPKMTSIKKMGIRLNAEAYFTIEMRFKDGRIRYSIHDLDMPFSSEPKRGIGLKGSKWDGWFIYDNKEKLYLKDQKAEIEAYFDATVGSIKEFITVKGTINEDW